MHDSIFPLEVFPLLQEEAAYFDQSLVTLGGLWLLLDLLPKHLVAA